MPISYFGYIAAICTTVSFIPQVYKLWKTRKTKGLSLTTYLIYSTGVFFWTVYGFLLRDPAILIANAITFIFVLPIVMLELQSRR